MFRSFPETFWKKRRLRQQGNPRGLFAWIKEEVYIWCNVTSMVHR